MNNLTSLFSVVVGFYFASSAVVEYGRTRAGETRRCHRQPRNRGHRRDRRDRRDLRFRVASKPVRGEERFGQGGRPRQRRQRSGRADARGRRLAACLWSTDSGSALV